MIKTPSTHTPYLTSPCDRCGSKRKVSKTWKEDLQTFAGTSVIEVSQIICTNKACQEEFERERAIEVKRKDEIRLKKEDNDRLRKEKIALARKNKN